MNSKLFLNSKSLWNVLKSVFLTICLLSAIISYGQKNNLTLKKNLKFYHYDTSNGLSNNTVSSITEDKIGFIWVGTGGL